jgi:Tol biopolymer transport system component
VRESGNGLIAFVAEKSDSPDETKPGFERIYTVISDGTAPRVLLEARRRMYSAEHYYSLGWAPDGTRIAVVSQSDFRAPHFTVNQHGGDRRALPLDPILTADAAWAPDGRLLAYTTGHDLRVIDSRTKEDRVMWSGRRGSVRHLVFGRLSWSPDGEVAAITGRSGARGAQVLRWFDVTTGETRTDVLPLEHVSDALLSPDGTAAAFLPGSATDCSRGLSILDLSTGRSRRVTDQCVAPGAFDWSPDGTQMVFVNFAGAPSDEAALWLVPTRGGAPMKVLTAESIGADRLSHVAWQPVPSTAR